MEILYNLTTVISKNNWRFLVDSNDAAKQSAALKGGKDDF